MIYIQIHFTTHGIAYAKHILSYYYNHPPINGENISAKDLSQENLNDVFDNKAKSGFVFKKVFYLYADQEVFNKISSVSNQRKSNIYEKDQLIRELHLKGEWKKIVAKKLSSLNKEIEFIQNDKTLKSKSELIIGSMWRNIQYYNINDQLYWFGNYSNAKAIYNKEIFSPVNMTQEYGLTDLRNHTQIVQVLKKIMQSITQQCPTEEYLINISLGSYETQVAWFVLAENNLLPERTTFISSYDDKAADTGRFKNFEIKVVPTKLFNELSESITIFNKTKSRKRELANLLIRQDLSMGFSILLLGERGVGKSRLAEQYSKDNFVAYNCAAFDNDSKAESALFGYAQGAFTDAKKDTPGLFQQANGGILFLDEVHHLSKIVQGKMMKALQTDEGNNFWITKMMGQEREKIRCSVIFASNLPIKELKTKLLPDFYDRISQLIIEIPSLRETSEDRFEDWRTIWKQLDFGEAKEADEILRKDKPFARWLKDQKLYGNFRDLQKIAILYRSYTKFSSDIRELILAEYAYRDAFQYVSGEYHKYFLDSEEKGLNTYFKTDSEPNEMLNQFRKDLVDWAIRTYGSVPEAYQNFYRINRLTPTAKTLYEWKKS